MNSQQKERKSSGHFGKASITRALVRVFTCCGISFSIIENPFFIKFLHEMRPGYMPPSRELFGSRLLNQEIARVNEKVKKIIEDSKNLTLDDNQKRMKYSSLESTQQDESNGSKIAFLGLILDEKLSKI
ncbi:ribonuclease H-like domain-containing protein [Rhizophagus irregularis DAOM 181602=DAOM 197198]|nr:ribonuclease H-like domain-containing protein [Rhizophagus irregularis DAOM 181602=DAOM 197198]